MVRCHSFKWFVRCHSFVALSFECFVAIYSFEHLSLKLSQQELKLAVTGSEVVGLIPRAAILSAAEFYVAREGLFVLEERQKVRLAVERLGLGSLGEFRAQEKIIE